MMEFRDQCPRCAGRLREWSELDDEEREVVKRLPASAELSVEERKAIRRWCTRCWYEASSDQPLKA